MQKTTTIKSKSSDTGHKPIRLNKTTQKKSHKMIKPPQITSNKRSLMTKPTQKSPQHALIMDTSSKLIPTHSTNLKTTLNTHSVKQITHQTQSRSIMTHHPSGKPEEGLGYQYILSKIHHNIPQSTYIQLINESNQHSIGRDIESHFKLTVIAPFSTNMGLKTLISRHRFVNNLLPKNELDIHSLSLHLYTEEEFKNRNGYIPLSPGCASGKKKLEEQSSV
jgi:BolA protein